MDSFAGDVLGGPDAGPADDLAVDVTAGTGRARDSAELPEQMRRDVRLLGEILGEVISESAGADLLADVERLRHAVIDARSAADRGSAQAAAAGDEITALVSSWSWERAEQVARAFTVYFHLVNLAEEEQRVRTLRLRDSGDHAPRESLADAVDRLTAEGGAAHLAELLAGLRVHPVFTAHPTEARRRAVVASLRRVSGLLNSIDDQRAGAAQQAEDRRKLREEVDLLWRTAQLRVAGMAPADEVRSVMTAFDETLFRLVPDVYRALDHVLLGAESGAAASPVPPFLRFGSWVGGDRDGNPNVTAAVTREAAVIQADHALRGLEAVCGRIGRAMTVYQDSVPPRAAPGPRGRLGRAPGTARGDLRPLAGRALPRLPAVRDGAARRDTDKEPRPGLRRGGGLPRRPAPRAVVAGRGRGGQAGLRGAAALDLADRDVRLPPREP